MLGLGNGLGFNRVIGVPFLLDKFSGAAAAYSLRALSSTTTDVVRVRRSSDNAEADFNPTEITDGTLLAWVGNTASDNGYVTTWYDQSGNSNDATQATAASQPKIVDAGSLVTENSNPAVSFDGVDDLLDIGQNIDLYSLASEYSIFMDTKIQDYALQAFQHAIVNDSSDSSPDQPMRILFRDENSLYFTVNGTTTTETLASATQRSLLGLIKRSSDIVISINGSSTTGIKGSTDFTTGLENTVIGNSPNGSARPAKLKTAELIIYDTDQSSNRGNIEANINDYYSIY